MQFNLNQFTMVHSNITWKLLLFNPKIQLALEEHIPNSASQRGALFLKWKYASGDKLESKSKALPICENNLFSYDKGKKSPFLH